MRLRGKKSFARTPTLAVGLKGILDRLDVCWVSSNCRKLQVCHPYSLNPICARLCDTPRTVMVRPILRLRFFRT